nr:MAG TPA: RecT protein [Caudoviricetes sp.]
MAEAKKQEVAVSEEKKEVAHSNNKVTDYSLGIFGTSDNFIMAMQMAKALSSSTIVPSTFQKNDANCLIAIEQAQRLKVSPLMVMQNLYVIQGRPSWSSKFLIAAINNSGKFDMELQFDETKDKNGKPFSCTAWTMKNGRRVEGMEVNMDMAKDEGWLGKNGSKWKTMPQLMLRYRAASFFSSLNCPELTMGLYTREEMQDNDFKEYPMENLQEQVKRDIAENANSEDFIVADAEAKEVESAAVEAEVVGPAENDENLPDFMKD